MFTGIVQNRTGITVEAEKSQFKTLSIELPSMQLDGLTLGASIALNGVCLTVKAIEHQRAYFDVMMETLKVTNLENLKNGDEVNVERAARFGDDIGGHVVSGHISSVIPIVEIERPENNCILWFGMTDEQKRYIFPKGFVSLNGCSLTIGEVLDDRFNVFLIPETLNVTTFGTTKVNDVINIEYDSHTQVIVETLERMRKAGEL